MWSIALKLAGPLFNWIKPMLAPLFSYFKGRSDGKRDAELKSRRHFDEVTNRAADARNAERMSDDSDPNNRD